jgi:peptidoglycan lytic transglycosylase
MIRRRVSTALAFLLLSGCGGGQRARVALPPPAPQVAVGDTEEGWASWYGHPYHGRPTSSGEIYDMEQLTAAHRTLPLGTRVRVENLSNGRDVEVRINDRGPFVDNRVIDLSHAAAQRLQMLGPGTARVRLHITGVPEAPADGFYTVQVGAFQNRGNAERLRESMARDHGNSLVQVYDSPRGRLYRVLVGRAGEPGTAQALAETLRAEGFRGFVLRVDGGGEANRL